MPKLLNSLAASAALAVALHCLTPEPAWAQSGRRTPRVNGATEGQAKKVKYKKDTKVNFDDEFIEGGVKNPFNSLIGGRDSGNKNGFIKIRTEWHDEMVKSVTGLSQ